MYSKGDLTCEEALELFEHELYCDGSYESFSQTGSPSSEFSSANAIDDAILA